MARSKQTSADPDENGEGSDEHRLRRTQMKDRISIEGRDPDFMDVSFEGSSVWSAIKSSLKRRRFRGLWRRASDIVQT